MHATCQATPSSPRNGFPQARIASRLPPGGLASLAVDPVTSRGSVRSASPDVILSRNHVRGGNPGFLCPAGPFSYHNRCACRSDYQNPLARLRNLFTGVSLRFSNAVVCPCPGEALSLPSCKTQKRPPWKHGWTQARDLQAFPQRHELPPVGYLRASQRHSIFHPAEPGGIFPRTAFRNSI